jgi:hypothetical protein
MPWQCTSTIPNNCKTSGRITSATDDWNESGEVIRSVGNKTFRTVILLLIQDNRRPESFTDLPESTHVMQNSRHFEIPPPNCATFRRLVRHRIRQALPNDSEFYQSQKKRPERRTQHNLQHNFRWLLLPFSRSPCMFCKIPDFMVTSRKANQR